MGDTLEGGVGQRLKFLHGIVQHYLFDQSKIHFPSLQTAQLQFTYPYFYDVPTLCILHEKHLV